MARVRQVFGPGPYLLRCDDRPIARVSVAEDSVSRGRGLLGTDEISGALWITRCPSVHMVGMRYPIDAATIDRTGQVLDVRTLRPWIGLTRPRRGASATVEAMPGAFRDWGVEVGSVLTVDRHPGDEDLRRVSA